MTIKKITIATRESLLALAQTNLIKAALETRYSDLQVDLLGITTKADKRLDVTLTKIGGKGLFVKELEEALFDGRADIAVHSMKDVPMELPEGLCLPVICERADPRDVFVSNKYSSLESLDAGAVVGTASIRRQLQIKSVKPNVRIEMLRGNIHTRLRRLDEGDFDAIILAAAGLHRMGFDDRIRHYLPTEPFTPAAGQGALGIECRVKDEEVKALIAPFSHLKTQREVSAERALCRRIGGGCSIPLAAYATTDGEILTVQGYIASPSGDRILRAEAKGAVTDAEAVGLAAAQMLIADGALEIIKEFQ